MRMKAHTHASTHAHTHTHTHTSNPWPRCDSTECSHRAAFPVHSECAGTLDAVPWQTNMRKLCIGLWCSVFPPITCLTFLHENSCTKKRSATFNWDGKYFREFCRIKGWTVCNIHIAYGPGISSYHQTNTSKRNDGGMEWRNLRSEKYSMEWGRSCYAKNYATRNPKRQCHNTLPPVYTISCPPSPSPPPPPPYWPIPDFAIITGMSTYQFFIYLDPVILMRTCIAWHGQCMHVYCDAIMTSQAVWGYL